MKWLINGLLILSAVVMATLLAYRDPGFVIIGHQSLVLETSLSVFLAVLLLFFAVLYLLMRLWSAIWRLPERWQSSHQSKMRGRAQMALQQGISELLEGDWKKAEKTLLQSQPQYLHYLSAAYAAQQRQNIEQRDKHLEHAQQYAPAEQHLAVNLAQAQLQLKQQQVNLAVTTLKPLQDKYPRHPQVLKLLAQAYVAQQNWHTLLDLLPELNKRKALSEAALYQLEVQTAQGELNQAAAKSFEAVKTTWERLSKVQRLQPAIAKIYVQHLIANGATDTAEQLLRDSIRQHWDKDLVLLYAHVNVNPAQQLSRAEGWLKQHEKDADLLLALGQLSMRNSLWGKAQQYLEASLGLAPRPDTYQALGDLLNQMGELEQAAAQYRKGLRVAMSE